MKSLMHILRKLNNASQLQLSKLKIKVKPHRGKILLLGSLIILYPVYYPLAFKLKSQIQTHKDGKIIQLSSDAQQKQQSSGSFMSVFAKRVVNNVLQDQQIQQQAQDVITKLASQQLVQQAIGDMLSKSVSNPAFQEQSKMLASILAQHVLDSPSLQTKMTDMTTKVFQDEQVKQESANVMTYIFEQKQTQDALSNLFVQSFQDEGIKQGMQMLLSGAMRTVLEDEETVRRIKMFTQQLLQGKKQESSQSTINHVKTNSKNGYSWRNLMDYIADAVTSPQKNSETKTQIQNQQNQSHAQQNNTKEIEDKNFQNQNEQGIDQQIIEK